MIAVFLVASVGSFVDWRKEIAFVSVKVKQMEKNVVSILPVIRVPEKKFETSSQVNYSNEGFLIN